MATIKGKFLSGLLGNMVYKQHQGKQVIQSKPYTPKNHLTEGTVKASKIFGRASSLSRCIREGLFGAYGKFYDGTMIYRLNAIVLNCLLSCKDSATQDFHINDETFKPLAGFEFNAGSPVKYQLFKRPVITASDTKLNITIPEMQIPKELKFEAKSSACKLIVAVAVIDFVHGSMKYVPAQMMEIEHSYQPTTSTAKTFEFETAPGCLCIIAISLQYVEKTFAGDFIINNKSFNPAAILRAYLSDGEVIAAEKDIYWNDIDFKAESVKPKAKNVKAALESGKIIGHAPKLIKKKGRD
jgi:hypothetical protein